METKKPDKSAAIISLVGGAIGWSSDSDEITYLNGQTPPTEAEIDAELTKLLAEYDSQEYARNREMEYPSIKELTIALYDTEDKAAIDAKRAAVKAKYPKPS